MKKEYISRKLYKSYFKIGFPMIVSHFITYFASNLTIALIGNLDEKAMSGYTVANETYAVFYMLALGITSSFLIFISQYYGEGNISKVNQIIRFGTNFSFIMGLLYSIAVFFFARPFCLLYVKDPEIIEYAVEYLKFFSWTFIPYVLNLLWNGVFSFIGHSKMAMISNAINCGCTVFFSILLVSDYLHMNMGVAGASLAILLARVIESLFLLTMLNHGESPFKFKIPSVPLEGHEKTAIIKKGIPLITNEIIYAAAYMVIVQSYSYANEEYLACYTVAYNIGMLNFSVHQACPAIVGFLIGGQLGKGNFEQARENGSQILRITGIYHLAQMLIMLALIPIIPRFYSLEGDLYDMAVKLLLIRAVTGGLAFAVPAIYNTLKIGGDSRGVFLTDGLFALGIQMVASIVLSRYVKVPYYVLYGTVEGLNILKALVNIAYYRKNTWLKKLEVRKNEI